jgi:hypothetical protein
MLLIYNHFMLNVFRKSNTYNTRKKVLNRIIFHNDKLFFQTSIRHNNDEYDNNNKTNSSKKAKENDKNSQFRKINRFSFIELEKEQFKIKSHLVQDQPDVTSKTNTNKKDSNQLKQKNKDSKKQTINIEVEENALDILASLINRLNKDEESDNLLQPITSKSSKSIKNETENKNHELKEEDSIRSTRSKLIKSSKQVESVLNEEEAKIKQLKNNELDKSELKPRELKPWLFAKKSKYVQNKR